jgi:hypothetical protein
MICNAFSVLQGEGKIDTGHFIGVRHVGCTFVDVMVEAQGAATISGTRL